MSSSISRCYFTGHSQDVHGLALPANNAVALLLFFAAQFASIFVFGVDVVFVCKCDWKNTIRNSASELGWILHLRLTRSSRCQDV